MNVCLVIFGLLMETMSIMSAFTMPMRGPVLQYFNSNKSTAKSAKTGGLLDRQIPDDVIYDLAGRMKLITRDETTDEYNVFTVDRDELGIPYVRDRVSGHDFVVRHSQIRRGVDIYRKTTDQDGKPVVFDWTTMTVNQIKLNNHGEVELVPIGDQTPDVIVADWGSYK